MRKFTDYYLADLKRKPFPWLPADDEPDNERFACLRFLEIGNSRTFRAVAQYFSLSPKTISRWAKKYGWLDRAYIYDKLLYRISQNADIFNINKFQREMFDLKMTIANNSVNLIETINLFITDIDAHYEKSKDIQKLDFCRKCLISLRHFYKISDLRPHKNYLKNRGEDFQTLLSEEFGIDDIADIKPEITRVMEYTSRDIDAPRECNGYAENEEMIDDPDFNPETDEIIPEPIDIKDMPPAKPIDFIDPPPTEPEEEDISIKNNYNSSPPDLPADFYKMIGRPDPDDPYAEDYADAQPSVAQCDATFNKLVTPFIRKLIESREQPELRSAAVT